MGSQDSIPKGDDGALPPASSPTLILTHPTPSERRRTWALTHPSWGPALSLDDYLEREDFMTTIPGSNDGRLSSWILTDSTLPPDQRPVLSSCDTLRKRALVARGNDGSSSSAAAQDGTAYGIGSVFTDPQYRGRGYASRMLRELGTALTTPKTDHCGCGDDAQVEHNALFSVLYSDIGKVFYAKHGWPPYESTHVSWTPDAASTEPPAPSSSTGDGVRPIDITELPELCAIDERLLRQHLPEIAARDNGRTPAVALIPDLDTMLWHLKREDFMTSHVFPDKRIPHVRGAVAGQPGQRVWAIWTRGYYGGLAKPENNTMHFLRVVVEDAASPGRNTMQLLQPPEPSDEQVAGFRAIVEMARREAAAWEVREVQLWNPRGAVKSLVDRCGVPGSLVEREEDSIASLMWYGDSSVGEVEWVANDKFGWC